MELFLVLEIEPYTSPCMEACMVFASFAEAVDDMLRTGGTDIFRLQPGSAPVHVAECCYFEGKRGVCKPGSGYFPKTAVAVIATL